MLSKKVSEFPKLYNGDCLEVLRGLPDKSVDLVVTDPPYDLKNINGGGSLSFKESTSISYIRDYQSIK